MKKKKSLLRKIAALTLTAVMLLTSMPVSILAVDEDAASANGTVYGEEETVLVSSDVSSRETDFNSGWKFYLGDNSSASGRNFDDSSWEDVDLPHDFSISQDFTTSGEAESGFLPGGTGWYRKSFTLTGAEADSTIVLSFDGVYSDAYVYVNGTYVGENHYGYTAFAFDITDYLVCDGATENVIAVKVVNNLPTSRWYSGSGIYRDVTLIVTEPVHVAYNGTYVTTPNLESSNGSDGTVSVEVELDNDSDTTVSVTVRNTVYTSDGVSASDTAETTATIGAGETVTVTSSPKVENPALWSTDDPNLYFVRTEVYVDGTLTDTCDTQFGFRWYSFDSDNGFYLNGEAVKLNGVCMHHDQGALGSAASYDAMYRQLIIMKDMGVNAIRTSHNPADEDFIDICNELGILVMEEAFDCWTTAKNGNSNDFSKYFSTAISSNNNILGGDSTMTWAEYAIKSMVKRDRNDASVILWSLGNELTIDSTYPTICQNLIDWINELDTTRPTTLGCNNLATSTSSYAGQVMQVIINNGGIVGLNYANSTSTLSSLHNAWGLILSSETSSAVNSRGIYTTTSGNDGTYHLSSYDNYAVSWGITAHDSLYNTLTNDYVAGEFVWTGFDYIGEPTPWNGTGTGSVSGSGAVPNSSYFGIVDTAGFEKDTYYLYRSQWNQDSTTLHLVTAWDSDNMYTSSGKTPVVIYTNAAKVELYRNGDLIGTATRTENTTDAGHTYYTYTTASNDTSVCTAVSATGSESLYATFNVTYEAGTISAIAYDKDGTVITDTSGSSVVSTPGTVSQLEVTQNKTVIDADGQSLVYIEVEVQDADGNLDTTATNTIYFTLSGDGEIAGVDNGDQATTEKYQQTSVLESTTSAHIAAYAGKALVIVRSTTDAGSFTVSVTSDGLTGGSATVTTTEVVSDTVTEGLVSYTLVRDYSVTVGTEPKLLTTVTGTLADGSTMSGTVVWDEISSEIYNTAGDYTITGTLSFGDIEGIEDITVIARLHVIADVIAMRNVSTVTMAGYAPTLPSTVNGVLADGTVTGEFTVTWDSVSANDFATVDDIITVNGTATVIGTNTLPVTCTVRVAETVNTKSVNVAADYYTLTEDCTSTSDNLLSIVDGVTDNSSDTSARWTNYNNRNNSSTAAITFTWSTAQLLSSVNLYFFTDNYSAALPSDVTFEYSLDGTTFTEITYADVAPSAGFTETAYVFDSIINPVALRITFTEQSGHCVGLTECEIMTYAGSVETNTSADLSGIAVDGTAVSGFDADTLTYEADGTNDAVVTATTEANAGITVLPIYTDGVVRILTVSEDSSTAKTYEVTLSGVEACQHENTEVRNAVAATCTGEGYTGDTYCTDCGAMVEQGSIIPATGHSTVTQNAKAATCTEDGYTGDEVCTVCGETVSTGSVIAATGHRWDSGTVTKEATEDEKGEMTYTCTVCGATKTETIAVQKELLAPSVTLSVAQGTSGKIQLTGTITDYENSDDYYEITGHGFVYITKAKLGAKSLTVNTSSRTKVSVSGFSSGGSYIYSITPKTGSTVYAIRAWITYTNSSGKTVYVYSNAVYTSYEALAQ